MRGRLGMAAALMAGAGATAVLLGRASPAWLIGPGAALLLAVVGALLIALAPSERTPAAESAQRRAEPGVEGARANVEAVVDERGAT